MPENQTAFGAFTPQMDSTLVTKKLGRYDILRVLGKGAMGVVYEARDPNLNRTVAIKIVQVDSLTPAEAAEYEQRFRTEAHSAARLQHPNIVSVYDSDRDGDTPYLVMEFVKGEDLKHYFDLGERFTLEQSVRMVCDLLAALSYAHRHKIIHRDIKPANMMIEADGRVKLADFGVARIQDSGEATRTQGGMVGTLKYMSPEQVSGKAVGVASDLFSAGIVLYQLLTDRRPFDGDSYFSIISQITEVNPPAPSSINPLLPVALDAVLARALAKDKRERYATANDLSVALQEAVGQADPSVIPSPNPHKGRDRTGTNSHERSGSTQGFSGSGSTVTQELELIYWKDVKDSDDVQDVHGYLRRFPDGVYADLAKRRLKRMAEPVPGDGQTVYEKTVVVASQRALLTANADDLTTLPFGVVTPPAAAPVFEPTMPPSAQGPTGSPPISPALAQANDSADGSKLTPAAAARRPAPWVWLGGAAVALILMVAVWFGMGRSQKSNPADLAGAHSAAPVAAAPSVSAGASVPVVPGPLGAASASVVAPGALVAAAPGASAAAPTAAASNVLLPGGKPLPSVTASQPRLPVVRDATKRPQAPPPAAVEAAPAPVVKPAPAARPAVTVDAAQSGPASAPARTPPPPAGGPKEACEGRVLLGFISCMQEQCARAAFTNHPVCVDWRAMDERRKASEQNR